MLGDFAAGSQTHYLQSHAAAALECGGMTPLFGLIIRRLLGLLSHITRQLEAHLRSSLWINRLKSGVVSPHAKAASRPLQNQVRPSNELSLAALYMTLRMNAPAERIIHRLDLFVRLRWEVMLHFRPTDNPFESREVTDHDPSA